MIKTNSFLLVIFLTVSTYLSGQCNPKLNAYAKGFEQISESSFSFLDDALANVRIVGYGEDTHGTAEFTELAQELMLYLSRKHAYNLFIIETGFGEGRYLNDYIHGKRKDLKNILNEHNSTWRYRTEEFYALMQRLRTYNENTSNKIYLYGCEMQYVIYDVRRIRDYLQQVGSQYTIDGFEKHIWQELTESEKTDYYISYKKLKSYLNENREAFIAKTSQHDFDLAYHHVEVLGQFISAIEQNVEQRKHDLRDLYMAENIQWILNFHGENTKALFWAHNAHVGDWVDNGIVDVAGHHLKKVYGDSYFPMATDFGTGNFLAFSQDWKMTVFQRDTVFDNTFSKCLQNLGKPNAFVNFREAKKETSLRNYLNASFETMSGAGAQIRNTKTESKELAKAFDAIIYLHSSSKINWLK